jgi:hypothetical protein
MLSPLKLLKQYFLKIGWYKTKLFVRRHQNISLVSPVMYQLLRGASEQNHKACVAFLIKDKPILEFVF